MNPRAKFNAALARQLARPSGLAGRLLVRRLNRGNQAMTAAAVEALDLQPASTAADIGFGGGIGLRLLLEQPQVESVWGIDVSEEMLSSATRQLKDELAGGRLRLEPGSLTGLPLPDSSLDGAITVNTVYFVEDLEAALRECARVLRGRGRVVIGIGDPEAMRKMPFTAHGFRLRSIADLEASIAAAGLELVDHLRVGDGKVPAHLLVAALS